MRACAVRACAVRGGGGGGRGAQGCSLRLGRSAGVAIRCAPEARLGAWRESGHMHVGRRVEGRMWRWDQHLKAERRGEGGEGARPHHFSHYGLPKG